MVQETFSMWWVNAEDHQPLMIMYFKQTLTIISLTSEKTIQTMHYCLRGSYTF